MPALVPSILSLEYNNIADWSLERWALLKSSIYSTASTNSLVCEGAEKEFS